MAKFNVWDPEIGQIEEDATPIEAYDADRAAHDFCERRWARDDYTEQRTVHVRDPDGAVSRWVVCAEQAIVFRVAKAADPVTP